MRDEILEAFLFLRRHNHSISDTTLDFMLESSLQKLDEEEGIVRERTND